MALSVRGYSGTVAPSSFTAKAALPLGNADTIVASLQPLAISNKKATLDRALALVRTAAETGRIGDYTVPECAGATGGPGISTQLGKATAQAGLQAGLSAVKIGSKALNAIPVVGSILSGAIDLFATIFGGHGRAVKTERATLCFAVPDAQNFLAQVDAYVSSGQWDHVTAVQEMEKGLAAWRAEVKGILQDTGGVCNEACMWAKVFRAAIEKRKLDYQTVEATLQKASKGFGAPALAGAGGFLGSLRAFLKSDSGTVQAGLLSLPFRSVGGALLVGGAIFGGFVLFSRMSRRTT